MAGTNPILGGGGFHHVAIRASDFERSVRFYTETLGCSEKIRWGEADKRGIMLDVGDGNYLEIFAGRKQSLPSDSIEPPLLHIALRTTRLDAVTESVRAAGMKITVEPRDIVIGSNPPTPIRLSFFEGPDGEVIELFQNEAT